MHELHDNVSVLRAISPASIASDTTTVGQIIDRANFEALEFAINTGQLTTAGATFTTTVYHGAANDMADEAAVPDDQLLGLESAASFTGNDDDKTFKIGYRGNKRYVRIKIVSAATGAAAHYVSAMAILAHSRKSPLA